MPFIFCFLWLFGIQSFCIDTGQTIQGLCPEGRAENYRQQERYQQDFCHGYVFIPAEDAVKAAVNQEILKEAVQHINAYGVFAQLGEEGLSSGAEGKESEKHHHCHCHPEDTGQGSYVIIPFSQLQQLAVGGDPEEEYTDPFFDASAVQNDDTGGEDEEKGQQWFPFGMVHDGFKMLFFQIKAQQEEGQKIEHTRQRQEFADITLIIDEGCQKDSCRQHMALLHILRQVDDDMEPDESHHIPWCSTDSKYIQLQQRKYHYQQYKSVTEKRAATVELRQQPYPDAE